MGKGEKSFFPLSPPVKKSLEGGSLPEVVILKGGPLGPGNLTKRKLNIRKYGSKGVFREQQAQNLPDEFRACLSGGGAPRLSQAAPGHGGLPPPIVAPSRPRHTPGPAWSLFSKLRHLTMCIPCSALSNGLLIFLIFKTIGDSSEGV